MNRVQSNYVYMAKSVMVTFEKNEAVWEGEPLIREGIGRLNGLIGKIDTEAARQKKNETPGFTAAKDRQRDLLEEQVYRMGGRLAVYAAKTGDKPTAEKVKFTRTKLNNMSMSALLTTARVTADTAEGLLEELGAYRVYEVDVKNLRELAATTDRLYAERDAAQGERSENTSQLTTLIGQLRGELKLMDRQVEAYIDDEAFLGTYFFSRRIHDIRGGSGKKTEEGGGEK